MKYKISDLDNSAIINAAVAKAEGLKAFPTSSDFIECANPLGFAYYYDFLNWRDAGPIIEREKIPNNGDLRAAMIAYLSAKFGEYVEISTAEELAPVKTLTT